MALSKLARLLMLLSALLPPGVRAQETNVLADFARVSPAATAQASPENAPPLPSANVAGELGAASTSQTDTPLSRLEIQDSLSKIRTIDLTTEPDDIWQRMRNGFAMPDLISDLVTSHQVWYLNRPDSLRRTLERSRRYLHFIVQELEKRGMPTELALLPMVESSYNPMAISPAQASGMWQFIPSTGRNYGLKQDWWADERRDIVASTNAALDYLQMLYEMQGDWHLALASYNWGEAAVARAMARNKAAGKPSDYLSLNMPAETRNYVPKLQALKNIISNPALFRINLPEIPNRPYFTAIKRPADMDVAMAAKLAETPLDEFRALNPGHNRPVLRAGGTASLVLPADKVNTFLVNLENTDKPLVTWKNYPLGKKETLAQVAAKFHMSVAQLKHINGLNGRSKVLPGHTLLVPARNGDGKLEEAGAGLTPPPEALAPPTAKAAKAGKVRHGSRAKGTKAAKSGKTARPGKATKSGKSGKSAKPGGKSKKKGKKSGVSQ
ncbi:MAG: transglycosylase SLT domain-containing protein [Rhodocyclaceae bacterium]|nr:transglycosylase SLT domain-containing protein [Rhodocyclaceae bacterium]